MNTKRESILICSRNELNREMISEILIKEGYKVEFVSELEMSFEEILTKEVHVLVLDITYENIKDPLFNKMLYVIVKFLPVVIVTKEAGLREQCEIRSKGIFYYLMEPINIFEFKQVVDESIKWFYKNFCIDLNNGYVE